MSETRDTAMTLLHGGQLETRQERQMAELERRLDGMAYMMTQMRDLILGQTGEIAKLNRALDTVRISRTQELAIQEAVRARAKLTARTEGMPGAEKRIASAIRTTIRETTGARAVGDIQAAHYDKVMSLIEDWHMMGALRKIRREMDK